MEENTWTKPELKKGSVGVFTQQNVITTDDGDGAS